MLGAPFVLRLRSSYHFSYPIVFSMSLHHSLHPLCFIRCVAVITLALLLPLVTCNFYFTLRFIIYDSGPWEYPAWEWLASVTTLQMNQRLGVCLFVDQSSNDKHQTISRDLVLVLDQRWLVHLVPAFCRDDCTAPCVFIALISFAIYYCNSTVWSRLHRLSWYQRYYHIVCS